MKTRAVFLTVGLAFFSGVCGAGEKVTINSSYPSPYGSYANLTVGQAQTDSLTLKEGYLRVMSTGGATGHIRSLPTASGLEIATSTNHNLIFETNNVERLRVQPDGNVALNMRQDVSAKLMVSISGTGGLDHVAFYDPKVGIELRSGGTRGTPYIDFSRGLLNYDARIMLTDNSTLSVRGAKLGIGTISPQAALQISDPTVNAIRTEGWGTLTSNATAGFFGSGFYASLSDAFLHSMSPARRAIGISMNYPGQNIVSIFAAKDYMAKGQALVPLMIATFKPVNNGFASSGMMAVGTLTPEAHLHVRSEHETGTLHISGNESEHYGGIYLCGGQETILANTTWTINHKNYTGFGLYENELHISLIDVPVAGGGARMLPKLRMTPLSQVELGYNGFTTPTSNLTANGETYKTSGGVKWAVPSDRRLKHDIAPLTGALQKLSRLRGVSFKWNEPDKHGGDAGTQIGMIAQEAEKVFPEWVSTGSDGYKFLSYNGFEALFTESMKETAAKQSALARDTDDAVSRLGRLRERVERLP